MREGVVRASTLLAVREGLAVPAPRPRAEDHRGSPAWLLARARGIRATPVAITSDRLTYTDSERKAHFEGNVVARGQDATLTANTLEAYLKPAEPSSEKTSENKTAGSIPPFAPRLWFRSAGRALGAAAGPISAIHASRVRSSGDRPEAQFRATLL